MLAQHKPEVVAATDNGNLFIESKTSPTENGSLSETQDKDVVSEGLGVVSVYDQWVAPPISSSRPKARYEVWTEIFGIIFVLYISTHTHISSLSC